MALSRVKTIDGLFLTSPTDNFNFSHRKRNASSTESLRLEFQRLSTNRLITTRQQLLSLIASETLENLSIICLNCQSFNHNASNLNNSVFQQSSIWVLQETWIQDWDTPPAIPNFK